MQRAFTSHRFSSLKVIVFTARKSSPSFSSVFAGFSCSGFSLPPYLVVIFISGFQMAVSFRYCLGFSLNAFVVRVPPHSLLYPRGVFAISLCYSVGGSCFNAHCLVFFIVCSNSSFSFNALVVHGVVVPSLLVIYVPWRSSVASVVWTIAFDSLEYSCTGWYSTVSARLVSSLLCLSCSLHWQLGFDAVDDYYCAIF